MPTSMIIAMLLTLLIPIPAIAQDLESLLSMINADNPELIEAAKHGQTETVQTNYAGSTQNRKH